jgi:hypothetical protein
MSDYNVNVPKPGFQSNLRSKVPRDAFTTIENSLNSAHSRITAIGTAASGSELVDGRDYTNSLRERNKADSQALGNEVIEAFDVVEQDTPNMTVKVNAGRAIVDGVVVSRGLATWTRASLSTTIVITDQEHGLSNGTTIQIDVSSDTDPLPLAQYTVANATTNTFEVTGVDLGDNAGSCEFSRYSGTLTAPTNTRYDLVVVNSDGTISIVAGLDSADPVYGTVASSQKPIAIIKLTSSTTTITNSEITQINDQGCLVSGINNEINWYFLIQDAIDSLDNNTGGTIEIGQGEYYEHIDLTGNNNLELIFTKGAKVYRFDGSNECLESKNTVGNETSNIKISGGQFYGNSKTGAISLVNIEYTDNFTWENTLLDGNDSSTATFQNYTIDNCDNFTIRDITLLDGSGVYTYARNNITNSKWYTSISGGIIVRDNADYQHDLLIYSRFNGGQL